MTFENTCPTLSMATDTTLAVDNNSKPQNQCRTHRCDLHLAVRELLSPTILFVLNRSLHCDSVSARDTTLERSSLRTVLHTSGTSARSMDTHCSAHREIAQHLLRYHVVKVLRFLGLIVVCCGVGEQPTASPPKWARGVLWALTGTHPCNDPPRQDGEPSERQLLLACLLVQWLLLS